MLKNVFILVCLLFFLTHAQTEQRDKYQYAFFGLGVDVNTYKTTYNYHGKETYSPTFNVSPCFVSSSLIEVNDTYSFFINTTTNFLVKEKPQDIYSSDTSSSTNTMLSLTDIAVLLNYNVTLNSFVSYGLEYDYEVLTRYDLTLNSPVGDLEEKYGILNASFSYQIYKSQKVYNQGIHTSFAVGLNVPFFRVYSGSVPDITNVDRSFVLGINPHSNAYLGYTFISGVEFGIFVKGEYAYRSHEIYDSATTDWIDIETRMTRLITGASFVWNFF